MKEFAIKRLKSLQYVFQGIFYLARNEAPVIVHIITSLLWVIGIIKDIAAGAVGFAVIPVTIVLGIIYYPYILKLF